MRLISNNGYVWKLTERQYAKLKSQLTANSREFDLDIMGVCLGKLISLESLVEHIDGIRAREVAFEQEVSDGVDSQPQSGGEPNSNLEREPTGADPAVHARP